ncbi:MAG: cysteine desulfurase family protein [Verrucomicrobium sp.]|nr:cysteine desulfurase family protein [Verrucomicrobium sp.]
MPAINLDHQGGGPLSPAVRAAMAPFLEEAFPSTALHRGGLAARDGLDKARAQVASLIGAAPEEIVFTSGGTESANLAVLGYARANRSKGTHLILAATEHAAVLRCAEALEAEGFTHSFLPVDSEGRVIVAALKEALRPGTILVAVHWANHEVGTLQPVAALAALCRERGIAFFSDAGAAAGWTPVDIRTAPVSLLSLSPYRFGGPKGTGALYVARGTALSPLLLGGSQENGLRAGTENLPAIAGAGAAAEEARGDLSQRIWRTGQLQRRLWDALSAQVPGLELNGPLPGPDRSVQNLNWSARGVEGEAQVLLCDMRGLLLSSGAACVSRDLRVSHVLAAMGLPSRRGLENVMATLGPETTEAEADKAAAIYEAALAKLRASLPPV